MRTSALLAGFVAALLAAPFRADAQQLTLQLQNGLVTLDAQNVSVRQILAEWARIGGAKIVNGEKVVGGPVTLQLNGVPERQALDTILRGVSGYMLAARQTDGAGLSGFDRILIMPTTSVPRTASAPSNPAFPPRQMPPAMPEVAEEVVAEDDDHDEQPEEEVVEEEPAGVSVPPQPAGFNPGMNQRFQRPPFPNPMGGVQVQPYTPPGAFPGPPQPVQSEEELPPDQQPPANPNVPAGASTVPGVISPTPQQQPPNQRPRRPPS